MSSCTGPQSPGGQAGELQYWAQSDHPFPFITDGRGWCWFPRILLIGASPQSQPSFTLISWSRTEDWQQKKDRYQRRPGRGRSW